MTLENQKWTPEESKKQNREASVSNNQENYFKVVKPIRTYERDLAEFIRDKEASKAQIHLEEQKKNTSKKKERNFRKEPLLMKKIIIGGLVFLVVLGMILVSLEISRVIRERKIIKSVPVKPEQQIQDTIIRADALKVVSISELKKDTLISTINSQKEDVQSGINIIYLTQKTPGGEIPISAKDFVSIAENAPQSLLRALGDKAVFGFVSTETLSPFVILEVESFDHTFAGMFSWEKNVAKDLKDILAKDLEPRSGFEDATSRNRDLRILRARGGETIVLYSFLDNKHLVITDKEEAFREILNRFTISVR